MSEKELLYLEDALTHEQFLQKQCTECASKLSDPELKNFVSTLAAGLLYKPLKYIGTIGGNLWKE
jgi:hypothetical protein